MWTFLAWVYSQAEKVYDWFSEGYWDTVWFISHFTDYLSQTLAAWVGFIYSWVGGSIDDVYNVIRGWVDGIYNWFGEVENQIRSWVIDALGAVYSYLEGLVSGLYDFISGIAGGIYYWVSVLVENTRSSIVDYVTGYVHTVTEAYNQLLPLINLVREIVTLTTTPIYNKLILQTELFTDSVVEFCKDPPGYIIKTIADALWDITETAFENWMRDYD